MSCRAPQPAWRFALFKSGHVTPLLLRDVSVELAEFFLEEVTPAQGGSYHCRYRKTDWGPGVWSQPSNVLELLVTDQLPRPSLVALPGPVVAPGANVSLRCAGRIPGMSFALYRVGVATPLQYIDSVQPWADFLLIGTHTPGTYCCYYHTPSAPYVLSQRSQPLVISYGGKKLWLSSFRPRRPGDINSIKLRDNSICVPETQKSNKTLGYGTNTLSPSFWLAGSGSLDYTQGNLIRLGLAAMVLICLGIVVTCDWHSRSSAFDGLLPQQN